MSVATNDADRRGAALGLPNLSRLSPNADQPARTPRKRQKPSDGAPNPTVVAGAKAVWQRMRALEAANVAGAVPAPSEEMRRSEIAKAEALLASPDLRQAQVRRITERYQPFVASVVPKSDEWRAVFKYVHDGKLYFNEYLQWTDTNGRYENDVTAYYEALEGDVDYDDEDWTRWDRPERLVFALHGLFARAPTLGTPTTLLRSAKSPFGLPHGPREEDCDTYETRNNWMPTPGRAYLNTTFVSTTLAPLNQFLTGGPDPQPKLSNFYERAANKRNTGCCMCAITVDADVPVVPIFIDNPDHDIEEWDDRSDWHHFNGEEEEVLLPPGLLYVFLGKKKVRVVDEKRSHMVKREVRHTFHVFFYRATLPRVL